MSAEDELLSIARQRESASEADLAGMWLDHPGTLRRQLRNDLARQVDLGRLKGLDDEIVRLNQLGNELQELVCPAVDFRSDSKLDFKIELEELQQGFRARRFWLF